MSDESVPLSLEQRVDEACDRFEEAWRAGQGPRIENHLAGVAEPAHGVLLRELLALEIDLRREAGDRPTPEEYKRLFPGEGDLIEAVFAKAADPPGSSEGATTPYKPPTDSSAVDLIPPSPLGSPPVPDRIGRYKVVRWLGGGTFGDVYLAHDGVMDRQVAIKVPSAPLVATERAKEEFLREARSVARLKHEGIIRAYDFGQEPGGRCYLVYEFVDGESLAERIKPERLAADPLPPDEAARIVAEVAEALHYAHLQEMFHRDVKPANILLDGEGRPKLTDFGLAVHEEDLAGQRGILAGTLPYMSPEQVRREGHCLDGRSDIYGLGVVLYELLCGRRPFRAMTEDELIDQILHREARPPRQVRDSIPRELERICLKALSKRMNERYTTAKDMVDELRRATRRVAAGEEAADTRAAGPLGNPVVEYLFVDQRRLQSYLDQVWPTVSEAPFGAGHRLTTHECVVRLSSYLQRNNLAVPYRPRRPFEREVEENRLRIETMTARQAHIPVTEQAPAFPGLNLWVSVHPDDEIRVRGCTPGTLFLIEDLHSGELIMHSGYSSLLLLAATLEPVPAYQKLVDT
jgi:serine/threonine protein kinase